MHDTAIIGMGNPLMCDEGIGVRVVQKLVSDHSLPDEIDVIDLGTCGLSVLHELEGRKRVCFIDCAIMGEKPGTIRRFSPEDVVTKKVQTRISLHEGDLLNTLSLARRLGICPEEVIIFGVEPECIDFGDDLSPALSSQLSSYVELIRQELVA